MKIEFRSAGANERYGWLPITTSKQIKDLNQFLDSLLKILPFCVKNAKARDELSLSIERCGFIDKNSEHDICGAREVYISLPFGEDCLDKMNICLGSLHEICKLSEKELQKFICEKIHRHSCAKNLLRIVEEIRDADILRDLADEAIGLNKKIIDSCKMYQDELEEMEITE